MGWGSGCRRGAARRAWHQRVGEELQGAVGVHVQQNGGHCRVLAVHADVEAFGGGVGEVEGQLLGWALGAVERRVPALHPGEARAWFQLAAGPDEVETVQVEGAA